jgi:hypothetical protein
MLSYYYSLTSVLWLQTARVVVWTSFPLLLVQAPLAYYFANVPLLVSVPVSLLFQFLSLVFRAALIDATGAESLPPRWFQLVSTFFRKKVLLHVTLQISVILVLAIVSIFLSGMFLHPNLNYVALSVPCIRGKEMNLREDEGLGQTQNLKCVNTNGVFYLLVSILVSIISTIRWHAYGMSRILRSVPFEWNSPSKEEQEDFLIKQPQKRLKLPSEVLWARIRRSFFISLSETIVVTVSTVIFTILACYFLSFAHKGGELSQTIRMILDISSSLTQPYREGASGVSILDNHPSFASTLFTWLVSTSILSSSVSFVYSLHGALLPLFLVDRVDMNDLLSGAIVSPIQPKELSGPSDALIAVLPSLSISEPATTVSKVDLALAALRTVQPKSLAHYVMSFPTEWIALRSRHATFSSEIGPLNSNNAVSYIPPVWKQSPPPLPLSASPSDEFVPGELPLTNLSLSISEFSENENAILTAWQTRLAVANWALASNDVSINGDSESDSSVSQLTTLLRLLVSTVTKSKDATRPDLWIAKETSVFNPIYSSAIPTTSPWLFLLRDIVLNSSSPLASTCQLFTDNIDRSLTSSSTYSYDFLSYSTLQSTSTSSQSENPSEQTYNYQPDQRNNAPPSLTKGGKNKNSRKIQFSGGEEGSSGAQKAMTVEDLGSPTDVHKTSSEGAGLITSRRFVRSLGAMAMSSAERKRLFASTQSLNSNSSLASGSSNCPPAEWMDIVWACTALIDASTISLLTRANVNSFSLAQYSSSRPPVWVLKSTKKGGGKGTGNSSFWDTLLASTPLPPPAPAAAAVNASNGASLKNNNQPKSSSQNVVNATTSAGVVKQVKSNDAVINWSLLIQHIEASFNMGVVGVNLITNIFLSTYLYEKSGGKSLLVFDILSLLVISIIGQLGSFFLRSSIVDLKSMETFRSKKSSLSSLERLRFHVDQIALSAFHMFLWRHYLSHQISIPGIFLASIAALTLSLIAREGIASFSVFKMAIVYINWTIDQIAIYDPSRESDERQKVLPPSSPAAVSTSNREFTLDDIIGGVSFPSHSSTQLCINLLRTLSPELSEKELTNLASDSSSSNPHNFSSSSFAALEEVIRMSERKLPVSTSRPNSNIRNLSTFNRPRYDDDSNNTIGGGGGKEGRGGGGLFASGVRPRHSASTAAGISQSRVSSDVTTAQEIQRPLSKTFTETVRLSMLAMSRDTKSFISHRLSEVGFASCIRSAWRASITGTSSISHLRIVHPFFENLSPLLRQTAAAILPSVLRTCSEEEASLLSDIRATVASAELLTSLILGGLEGDDALNHQVPLSLPVVLYSFASCVAATGILAASPRYNKTFAFGSFWEWIGIENDKKAVQEYEGNDSTQRNSKGAGIAVIEMMTGRSSSKVGGNSATFAVAARANIRPGLATLSAVMMKCLTQLFSSKTRGVAEHLQVITDKAPSPIIRSILRLAAHKKAARL